MRNGNNNTLNLKHATSALIFIVYMDSSSYGIIGHHCTVFQVLQKPEGSYKCIAHCI